jgi:hypothetical protein
MQPGGAFSAFDISFADPVTGDIFIADRSNASVDIFSGSSETFLGRATGFTGQIPTSAGGNSVSGADGVVTVSSGGTTTLYAGDGKSTLRVFNATNPASPTLLQAISTGAPTPCPVAGATTACRVDEMAYSPTAHLLLAANNADTPAFGNLFSTTGLANAPATLITVPGVGIQVPTSQGGIDAGGMEQPAWDPKTGTFFVSIPQLCGGTTPCNPHDPGGVAEISTTGTVLRTISLASLGIGSCSPAGLAVGGDGNLMVGCNTVGAKAILLNPGTTPGAPGPVIAPSIVQTFAGLGGTDELWYDPRTNAFYVTGNNGSNTTRFFDIVTDDGAASTISQTVHLPTTTSAHSITVNPFNGDVFVALAGTAGASGVNPCPTTAPFTNPGCIEVLAQVPEPSSLPVLVVGLTGLIGLAVRRRLQ